MRGEKNQIFPTLGLTEEKTVADHAFETAKMMVKKDSDSKRYMDDSIDSFTDSISYLQAGNTVSSMILGLSAELAYLAKHYEGLMTGIFAYDLNYLNPKVSQLTNVEKFIEETNQLLVRKGKSPICIQAHQAFDEG